MGRPRNSQPSKVVSVRLDADAAAALEFLQNRRGGLNVSRFFRQMTLELARDNGYAPQKKETHPCESHTS